MDKDDPNRTVYHTPRGKVYHNKRSCGKLRHSRIVNSITLRQAQNKGLWECSACLRIKWSGGMICLFIGLIIFMLAVTLPFAFD